MCVCGLFWLLYENMSISASNKCQMTFGIKSLCSAIAIDQPMNATHKMEENHKSTELGKIDTFMTLT